MSQLFSGEILAGYILVSIGYLIFTANIKQHGHFEAYNFRTIRTGSGNLLTKHRAFMGHLAIGCLIDVNKGDLN